MWLLERQYLFAGLDYCTGLLHSPSETRAFVEHKYDIHVQYTISLPQYYTK